MDLSQESFARLKFDNKSLKTAKKRLLLRVGNVILGVEAGHYTHCIVAIHKASICVNKCGVSTLFDAFLGLNLLPLLYRIIKCRDTFRRKPQAGRNGI